MIRTFRNVALVTMILALSLTLLNCQTNGRGKNETAEEEETMQEKPEAVTAIMKTTYGDIELELWPALAPKTVENFVKLGKEGFYDDTYFHRVIPDFMIQGGDPNTKDDDRSNDGQGGPGYTFEDECYEQGEQLTGEVDSDEKAMLVWSQIIVPYMQSEQAPSDEIFQIVKQVQEQQSGESLKGKTIEYYQNRTGMNEPLHEQVLKSPVLYSSICMANSGPNTNGSQFFIVTKEDGTPWLNGKHTVFGKVTSGMDVVHEIENLPRDEADNPKPENQAFINSIAFPE
ncbi:MAG: peptidylprolyl isomerase [Candidatus Syntrophosphaera sp.]